MGQHISQFIQNVLITAIARNSLLHSRRLCFRREHDLMEIPHIMDCGLCVPGIAASLDAPLHFFARIFARIHSLDGRLLDGDGDRRGLYDQQGTEAILRIGSRSGILQSMG